MHFEGRVLGIAVSLYLAATDKKKSLVEIPRCKIEL